MNSIYRIVVIEDGEITEVSRYFFSTKEKAIKHIESENIRLCKLFGGAVEKYTRHPWDLYDLWEGKNLNRYTVTRLFIRTDKFAHKQIVGLIENELD